MPIKNESVSSNTTINGVRQANINEELLLAKFEKIKGTSVKQDANPDAKPDIKPNTNRQEPVMPSLSDLVGSPISRESFSTYPNVWSEIGQTGELEIDDNDGINDIDDIDEDTPGKPLLVFEQPQKTDRNNIADWTLQKENEMSFQQTKISREQRKLIKTLKKEEEERPMIFFEKSDSTPLETIAELPEQNEPLINSEGKIIRDEDPSVQPSGSGKRTSVAREIFDWVKHITIAIAIGLLLVIFVVQRNVVVGSSMEPNLYDSDQLFVQKVSKLFPSGITHGDIITVNAEGLAGHTGDRNIIKRVIGLPGDKVDINPDGVYCNGVKILEPYINSDIVTKERDPLFSHVKLGENQYYVLGDNRGVSLDSRMFGPIDKSRVIGEVLIRFYPLNKIGTP